MADTQAILNSIGLVEHKAELNWGEQGFFMYCTCGTYTDYFPLITPLDDLNTAFNVHKKAVDRK